MGSLGDSMVVYAQPLFDKTDGSHEDMQYALSMAKLCWNLALLSRNELEKQIAAMQPESKMNEAEFADFRDSVLMPMIVRHHEMFPGMRRMDSQRKAPLPHEKKPPETGRNAPCPCNSGKKYKRCCGK